MSEHPGIIVFIDDTSGTERARDAAAVPEAIVDGERPLSSTVQVRRAPW